jgi:thiamine-monophosphate kinase
MRQQKGKSTKGNDLSRLGEFGVIELFRKSAGKVRPWVESGIGDDCAVLRISKKMRLLVTTDMLLDRVHFLREKMVPKQLGYKSMAANISDIAAMGGEPRAAFLAVGLSPEIDKKTVLGLRDGLMDCAREYGVDLLGGDTVASKKGLVLCLTVLGVAPANQVVYRHGAKPGDLVMLGGVVGNSAAGFYVLMNRHRLGDRGSSRLLGSHCTPRPQVALGRLLARQRWAHAMIDVSDGLLQDLNHICESSGVGAKIDADVLPVSKEARKLAHDEGRDVRDWALSGGEDYVLLFSVSGGKEAQVQKACSDRLGLEVRCIGSITKERRIMVRRDGKWSRVAPLGYDAFRMGEAL